MGDMHHVQDAEQKLVLAKSTDKEVARLPYRTTGKKIIKVTPSQVAAAQARVIADRRLGTATPNWIVRISKLGPHNLLA